MYWIRDWYLTVWMLICPYTWKSFSLSVSQVLRYILSEVERINYALTRYLIMPTSDRFRRLWRGKSASTYIHIYRRCKAPDTRTVRPGTSRCSCRHCPGYRPCTDNSPRQIPGDIGSGSGRRFGYMFHCYKLRNDSRHVLVQLTLQRKDIVIL